MYACYANEIPDDFYIKNNNMFVSEITFTYNSGLKELKEFMNNDNLGVNRLKEFFEEIHIKFDSIDSSGLRYTLNDKTLYIDDLSSGERMLLYCNIISDLGKTAFITGILDRLDEEHIEIMKNYMKQYNKIVLVSIEYSFRNQDIMNEYYKPFDDIRKELNL